MFPYAHNIYYKMKEIAKKLTHVIHALETALKVAGIFRNGWQVTAEYTFSTILFFFITIFFLLTDLHRYFILPQLLFGIFFY